MKTSRRNFLKTAATGVGSATLGGIVTLEAGATRTITFRLTPQELSFRDDNGNEVLEHGHFRVWVGADSLAELGAEFEIGETDDGIAQHCKVDP